MTEDVIVCPKCDRVLEPGEVVCPVDHGVPGGVYGISRSDIEATPRNKRYLLGLTVNGSYTITGFLGAGGFGAVYRARQIALDRDVALKILLLDLVHDETTVERFKREARTSAALLDPNIVTLFDFGETRFGDAEEDHVLFFTMELIQGPTLRWVLKHEKGLDIDSALQYGINILRGLAAAHHLGVVHRDLKPSNVLIDQSKNRKYFARLFDFGIASLQGSGGATMHMGEGGALGTPKYMAPEQWKGQPTSPCTDIYAFGVMMAEMLMGKPPVPKMEMPEMAAAHCRGPRPEVRVTAKGEPVPEALTNFIMKCMAIDPRQRYASAREALDELELIDKNRDMAPIPTISRFGSPGFREEDVSASHTYHAADLLARDPLPSQAPGHMRTLNFKEPPVPAFQEVVSADQLLVDNTHSRSVRVPDQSQPIYVQNNSGRLTAATPRANAFSSMPTARPLGGPEEEIIAVQYEEKRPIWPWILGIVGVVCVGALVFVGLQIAEGLKKTNEPAAVSAQPIPTVQPLPTQPAVVAVGDPTPAPTQAQPEPAAQEEPKPEEPAQPEKTEEKPKVAASESNKATTQSATTKPKPKPKTETKTEPAKTTPAPQVEVKPSTPAVAKTEPVKVTPPQQDTNAQAMALYRQGMDTEARDAPKQAKKLYEKALSSGLSGPQADDARRRIKAIDRKLALEEEF